MESVSIIEHGLGHGHRWASPVAVLEMIRNESEREDHVAPGLVHGHPSFLSLHYNKSFLRCLCGHTV
jgi:hypothetical protein